MHLARELFPSILEVKGLLPRILLENFYPSRSLYQDIIDNNLKNDFKNFINSKVEVKVEKRDTLKNPQELMRDAGYELYECLSDDDIYKFRKYYHEGEALCTFRGGRLKGCYVFFAVKDGAEELNREDFKFPSREDKYATSVISIQFTRDASHSLSIKNRYNHKVDNPDATFSNNLDNIIEGLSESFARYYGLKPKYINTNLEIPNYVRVNNKYYKYNMVIRGVYYCPDNIIIKDSCVLKLDKAKYIVFDYFILSLSEKTITLFDGSINDSFISSIGSIKDSKIEVTLVGNYREVKIIKNDGVIKLILDNENKLVSYTNPLVEEINSRFLYFSEYLREINIPNVKVIQDHFLFWNQDLEQFNGSNIEIIGNNFLRNNLRLESLDLSLVRVMGRNALYINENLTNLNISNVTKIGDYSFYNIKRKINIKAYNLERVGVLKDFEFKKQIMMIIEENKERNKHEK